MKGKGKGKNKSKSGEEWHCPWGSGTAVNASSTSSTNCRSPSSATTERAKKGDQESTSTTHKARKPPKSKCTTQSTTWIVPVLRWRKPSRSGPTSWQTGTFLTESLERWREYTEHFQKQEKTCHEEIAQAKEELVKAKADFMTL